MTTILVLVCIVLIAYILITFNTLIISKNKVKQAKSSIDIYLTKRFDLIPNLVSCVKGYMKHEKEVNEKIAELRTVYKETKNINSGAELNYIFNNLMAIAENYPDLKAGEQFLNLQKNLSRVESELQAARRLYNSEVTMYNNKVQSIPSNIIAKLFGFKTEDLFKSDEEIKKNIKIEL